MTAYHYVSRCSGWKASRCCVSHRRTIVLFVETWQTTSPRESKRPSVVVVFVWSSEMLLNNAKQAAAHVAFIAYCVRRN